MNIYLYHTAISIVIFYKNKFTLIANQSSAHLIPQVIPIIGSNPLNIIDLSSYEKLYLVKVTDRFELYTIDKNLNTYCFLIYFDPIRISKRISDYTSLMYGLRHPRIEGSFSFIDISKSTLELKLRKHNVY